MHLDPNTIIAAGVGLNLLFTVAHHIFTKPAQQAQLDSIENTVNGLLNTVTEPTGKDGG